MRCTPAFAFATTFAATHLLALFRGEDGDDRVLRCLLNFAKLCLLGVADAEVFHGFAGVFALGDRGLQLCLLLRREDALNLLAGLLGDLEHLALLCFGQVEGCHFGEGGFELGFLGVGQVELGHGHAGVEAGGDRGLHLLTLFGGQDGVDFSLHFLVLGFPLGFAGGVGGFAFGTSGGGLSNSVLLTGCGAGGDGDRGEDEEGGDRGEDCGLEFHGNCGVGVLFPSSAPILGNDLGDGMGQLS